MCRLSEARIKRAIAALDGRSARALRDHTPEQKRAAFELDPLLIEKHGPVSAEVTDAMARGALEYTRADIAVSVTGVAGPEPDERGNLVGLIFLPAHAKRGNGA